MVRSLTPSDNQDVKLILDMGEISTDLAVVYGTTPRLVRTVPTGLQSLGAVSSTELERPRGPGAAIYFEVWLGARSPGWSSASSD